MPRGRRSSTVVLSFALSACLRLEGPPPFAEDGDPCVSDSQCQPTSACEFDVCGAGHRLSPARWMRQPCGVRHGFAPASSVAAALQNASGDDLRRLRLQSSHSAMLRFVPRRCPVREQPRVQRRRVPEQPPARTRPRDACAMGLPARGACARIPSTAMCPVARLATPVRVPLASASAAAMPNASATPAGSRSESAM